MMLLQQSNFCPIPSSQFPSLKQRNPFLHHLQFRRKDKASTFRISSLAAAGFFNDVAQIAHNKVPHLCITCFYVSANSGFCSKFCFFIGFLSYLLRVPIRWAQHTDTFDQRRGPTNTNNYWFLMLCYVYVSVLHRIWPKHVLKNVF